jgi:hypothetical protein
VSFKVVKPSVVRVCADFSISLMPGCRKSEDRLACFCIGQLCNGEDWKTFHNQSLELPVNQGQQGLPQRLFQLLQQAKPAVFSGSTNASTGPSLAPVDRRLQEAEENIRKRKIKTKSLFGKVFWWWSKNSSN